MVAAFYGVTVVVFMEMMLFDDILLLLYWYLFHICDAVFDLLAIAM